ncbi:DNA polymerase I [Candidatus Berkiella cookevillensis]|uniref:DNA polymerase I n=1 Tax=Candidatus Berkiella cookevillensis TaxID=437022 RepID=A0A0Q9YSB5_9GAMM|nr:DNA polymerase I [Candidatus Berkiella cookevillensis]MCS5709707.1 DNA polymerase I [Candidatus Berkiella cookevillensis]
MQPKETKKLVLVDGSSYLFRAYHALPPLTNTKGVPTGAVYGVVNMLRKLIKEEKPDYLAVIFDTKSKNFRHALFDAYKANRPEMPEELAVQIKPLHDIIQSMGIPLLAFEGLEADDVIGTLSELGHQQNLAVLISTGDKDMAQLVKPGVLLVNTMSGTVMDEKGVEAKFGVRPDQIIDYLALMGDSVDNIPGVPKVGPKTAQKWLNQYETLDNLISHQNEITGKVGEYFRAHMEFLPIGKQLVTIKTDLVLEIQPSDLIVQPPDNTALLELYTSLEFNSWLKELAFTDKASVPSKQTQYETLFEREMLDKWIADIQKVGYVVVDTETTSINPHLADLVGISLSIEEGKACYIPLTHHYLGCPPQLAKDYVLDKLKAIFTDNKIQKIGQHLKYDMHVLHNQGMQLEPISHDTMLASYCYHSTQTRHDMDSMAKFYLNYETISFEAVAGKGVKQITFDQVEVEKASQYAAEDADVTLRLHRYFQAKLKENKELRALYEALEMPLVEVLYHMEQAGVLVDEQKLNAQSQEIAHRLAVLEEEAYVLAGCNFNLGSPKQLQEILYEKFNLPVTHKTPKGAPSTSEEALQELAHDYDFPRLILEHRSLSKLKSTYTDKLPLLINPNTRRIHTSYHQAVTATGRLSSSDPNLQNIPIRTEEGRKIRQAFIAKPGFELVSADYSQIELRIMAHLSQDAGLLKAFQANEDIHRFTASEVFGVDLRDVTAEQRRSAKAINFGLIYGMSAFGLARQLDIEQGAAKAYMELYFKRYPGVKNYMDAIRETARQQGFVETLLGRRLYLPDINAKQALRRKQAERIAINAPMQGTAADIIKRAMLQVYKAIKGRDDINMLMQVHDELVFEVKQSSVEEAKQLIKQAMESSMELSVPLLVEIGSGLNWDEAH